MAAEKCPAFSVTIKGDPNEVFEKAKKTKLSGGLKLEITGDATKGELKLKNFLGILVYGDYVVKDKKVTFNMVDDTSLADCKTIQEKVTDAFKGL
jgi:hypothetical protein